MFYAGSPKIRSVSLEEIQGCAVEVETGVASLEGAHGRFLERAARVLSDRQPNVFRYLTEAILEPSDDGGDSLELSTDDEGGIFLILATVIKALDEKGLPESKGRE
jgi:hypothetical protein